MPMRLLLRVAGGGDFLRLFHREREGYLVASLDADALRAEEDPLDRILLRDAEGGHCLRRC